MPGMPGMGEGAAELVNRLEESMGNTPAVEGGAMNSPPAGPAGGEPAEGRQPGASSESAGGGMMLSKAVTPGPNTE